MRPVNMSALLRAARPIAVVLVVAFLAFGLADEWGRVSSYEWRLNGTELAAGGLLGLLSLLMMALGYVVILEQLAGRRLPRRRLVSVWARSLLARYVPGNVLMVAGRVVLGREAGVPGRVSLAGSAYEQAIIVGLSAVAAVGYVASARDGDTELWLWLTAPLPLGLALLHPRVFGPLANAILRRVGRPPLGVLLRPSQLAGCLAWYAAYLVVLSLAVYFLVRGVAGPGAGGPVLIGTAYLTSFVISMLAFVFPSGLGIREGVFAVALSPGLSTGVAIAVAAALRLGLTLVELAFVGIVVAASHGRGRPVPERAGVREGT